MVIRKQDVGVLACYYFGYSKIQNAIFRLKRKTHTRFVAFHDITPQALESFETKLYFLKKRTNVVSLDDFFLGRLSTDKINIVITFDDGFKSWVSYAIPALKKNGFPAIFFISSGFVGLTKEDETDFIKSKLLLNRTPSRYSESGLSPNDIKSIVEDGFDVGGHTLSHCNLSNLRERKKISCEIVEDKQRLEKMAGRKIKYFSYPLGVDTNPDVDLLGVLRDSGYHGAVTTNPGFNGQHTNRYYLHRELTSASMPLGVFKARVYGNYDAVGYLKKLIRRCYNK